MQKFFYICHYVTKYAMINKHRYCVIMCGGIGSRFWPYSRSQRPKQFIDFFGTGRSLLQMTFDRIAGIVDPTNIIVVTNNEYRQLVKEQLPDLSDDNILLEPARRNTAPCIAWATWHIAARDPQASVIVTPSDHLITREEVFRESVLRAFEFAETNEALVTLGIKPPRPETGYGYIQVDKMPVHIGDICKVKTFTEKPNLELAKVFISTGEFFWNSGIFIWTIKNIKEAFMAHMPDMSCVFEAGADKFRNHEAENKYIAEIFPGCVSISIDYAIMEKASNVYVEIVDFGWSDLGTWSALYDFSPRNRDGNVAQNCRVMSYDSSGNMIAVKDDKLIVIEGIKDYIIADSGDVLLICPKNEEQKIKQFVHDANTLFGDKYM